jgi:hypothetical protein
MVIQLCLLAHEYGCDEVYVLETLDVITNDFLLTFFSGVHDISIS